MITLKSFDGGEFDAHIVLPASGYGPGIVVLQEIFGVNNYMRQVCDWYAARGFLAICPDLFWRQERGVDMTDQSEAEWQKAFALYQGLDEAKAVEDSAAAMEFLRQHPACNGRVGAVGFCLGGNLAWLLSVRFKPDCAVRLKTNGKQPRQISSQAKSDRPDAAVARRMLAQKFHRRRRIFYGLRFIKALIKCEGLLPFSFALVRHIDAAFLPPK